MNTIEGLIVRWQPWTTEAILRHIWQSSVIGLAILALMFAASRASARTRWLMGWIGLITFVLPVAWFTPSLAHLEPLGFDRWNYMSTGPARSEGESVSRVITTTPAPMHTALAMPSSRISWEATGAGIWATGAFFLIGGWWLRGLRFRNLLISQAGPVSQTIRKRVERARVRAGLAETPCCVEIDGVRVLGILGVVSPVVVLPPILEATLSDAEMESVLIHEFTHLRRRDTILAGLQAVLVRLFWFDPVVWLLNRQLCVEMEKSCDEAVLEITNDAESYAGGILKMVRQSLGAQEPGFAGATSVPIVARVRNILNHSAAPHRRWPRFVAISAAVVLMAFSEFSGAIRADTSAAAPPGKVLIFRNIPSWNRTPDFEAVLRDLGYNCTTEKSKDIAAVELSQYSLVVIPGSQWQTGFYADYASASDKFDRYVKEGGTLLLELNGAESEGITLPGGATMVREEGYVNVIMQPHHPALAPFYGKLRISAQLASHGYLKDVPSGATILAAEMVSNRLEDDLTKPTYVEYAYGAGRVIGACQCFHDQDGSHRGPLMPTVLKYAMARSWFEPDRNAEKEVGAMFAAAEADEGRKFATILKFVADRHANGGPVNQTSGVKLASGIEPVSALTDAGTGSPRATVETVGWAMYHGELKSFARLLKLDSRSAPLAALLYSGLPANVRSQVTSPEEMMAALIIYGYPTGVGFQITGDNQNKEHPDDWSVHGRLQLGDNQVRKVNFALQGIDGNWMLVANPGNVIGLGGLLTDSGELRPQADM